MGYRSEEEAARDGAALSAGADPMSTGALEQRLAAVAWPDIEAAPDAQGFARLPLN